MKRITLYLSLMASWRVSYKAPVLPREDRKDLLPTSSVHQHLAPPSTKEQLLVTNAVSAPRVREGLLNHIIKYLHLYKAKILFILNYYGQIDVRYSTCLSSDLPVGSRLLSGDAPIITFIISSTHWGVQKACPERESEPTPRRKPRVAHASCCNAATWLSRLSQRSSREKRERAKHV